MRTYSNNFDAIRHIAALLVLWGHSFSLSRDIGTDPLAAIGLTGALGVNIFFALSGFLITKSWLNRYSLGAFIQARALRIMPALVASVLACALLIGPILSSYDLKTYVTDWYFRGYVIGNITMLWPVEILPGIFQDNPHPSVVNGSLWTLPKEALMYLVTAVTGLIAAGCSRRISERKALVLCFIVIFITASYALHAGNQTEQSLTLSRVSRYFAVGAILFLLTDKLSDRKIFVVLASLAMLSTSPLLMTAHIVSNTEASAWLNAFLLPWALTSCVLFLATEVRLPKAGGRWKFDISYGLYVYGYPIQQVLLHFFPEYSAYTVFGLSFCLTTICAVLSWIYIEQPALMQKTARHNTT